MSRALAHPAQALIHRSYTMTKRIRKFGESTPVKSKRAFSAGRVTRETAVNAARTVKSTAVRTVGSAFYAVRDFGRGLFASN
jgi:hypothetical protein